MPLFSCERLCRRPWFTDLSLTLEAGEIVVLSGSSGSGKTLLLRTLADLDPPDPPLDAQAPASILLQGKAASRFGATAWRRRVGYVAPRPGRFPGTVGEHRAKARSLVPEPWGTLPAGLPTLAPSLEVERLSSGESQLLQLERAFLPGPEVLLLDEATGNLDPERARAVEQALGAWARGGHAILWVSHDPNLADRLSARSLPFPPARRGVQPR